MWETQVRSLGWEGPLEKGMAIPFWNLMNTAAWWAIVHGVAKSQTWLSNEHFILYFSEMQLKGVKTTSFFGWPHFLISFVDKKPCSPSSQTVRNFVVWNRTWKNEISHFWHRKEAWISSPGGELQIKELQETIFHIFLNLAVSTETRSWGYFKVQSFTASPALSQS